MKKPSDNEIDIIKVILILWHNKSKLLLITFLFFFLASLYQLSFIKNDNTSEKIKLATTEIKAITTFEELKYVSYNSYINRFQKPNNIYYEINSENEIKSLNNQIYIFEKFREINRNYLLNLFLEKLSDDATIINVIKKFDFIKKKNYPNNIQYEEAVIKFASSIQLIPPQNQTNERLTSWQIQHKTNDEKTWENFLKFFETSINREIRDYLIVSITQLIKTTKEINQYEIEDLEMEIKNINKDNHINDIKSEKDNFLERKRKIIENKNLDRLRDIVSNALINNSDDFNAAKIEVKSTVYKNLSNNDEKKNSIAKILMFTLIGFVFSIFYVLIFDAIKRRI